MVETYCVPTLRLADFYGEAERDNPGYWICDRLLCCAVSVPAYTDDIIDAAAAGMLRAVGKCFSKASADRYLRGEFTDAEKLAMSARPHKQFIRARLEAKGWTIQCGGGRVQVVRL